MKSTDPRSQFDSLQMDQRINMNTDTDTALSKKLELTELSRFGSAYLVCLLTQSFHEDGKPGDPVNLDLWGSKLPNINILKITALGSSENPMGGFIDETKNHIVDVIESIRECARDSAVQERNIIICGSGADGFAAIMVATALDGALALVQDPAINLVEDTAKDQNVLAKGLSAYSEEYPHRVRVINRLIINKLVPSLHIVSHRSSIRLASQSEFIKDLYGDIHLMAKCGDVNFSVMSTAPSEQEKASLGGLITHALYSIENGWAYEAENSSTRNYNQLVEAAIALRKQITFIRTEADEKVYTKTKDLLYSIAREFPDNAWPYMRICEIVSKWELTQGEEVLSAALSAFQRAQTSDAFVYACRGYINTNEPGSAAEKIDQLMAKTDSLQIANVGNVFKAVLAYEDKNFVKYEDLINVFRENKDEDFNPYMSIPVSTVFTRDVRLPESFSGKPAKLMGIDVPVASIQNETYDYIISTSCDQRYFELYGEFLVKSFTQFCSGEAALHLTVVDGDLHKLETLLAEWGASNVFLSVLNLDAGENTGAVSSLVRFVNLAALLTRNEVPVLVVDLDTVILQSLKPLVEDFRNTTDVGSRILRGVKAPWEIYTGGFALFYPTVEGKQLAASIAYVAGITCKKGGAQWWIDQNCFEAGIRLSIKSQRPLRISDLFKVRDEYCVMPVGPIESKTHFLRRALESNM